MQFKMIIEKRNQTLSFFAFHFFHVWTNVRIELYFAIAIIIIIITIVSMQTIIGFEFGSLVFVLDEPISLR